MKNPDRQGRPSRAGQAGFTLLEILTVLAIIGLVAAISLPPLVRTSRRLRVSMAAQEIAGALRRARLYAVRTNSHVAVRFTESGERLHWALYGDGDGDGVRTRDIRSGRDPLLEPPRRLRRFDSSVRPGFPPGPPPRDPARPRRRLGRPDDPLRFGRSDIVSFGPLGTSTSGTLYLSDGVRWTAAVRVYGTTGKVRVIVYDPETEAWR